MSMYGPDVHNRFYDKSYGLMVYSNGLFAANADVSKTTHGQLTFMV